MLSPKFVCKDDLEFKWKTIIIGDTESTNSAAEWKVSNEECPLPEGLTVIPDFLSFDEASVLYKEVADRDFIWEGFEQRRKVQRYGLMSKCVKAEGTEACRNSKDYASETQDMPSTLQILIDRLEAKFSWVAQHVLVEVYSPKQTLKITQFSSKGYNSVVTSFETPNECPQCASEPMGPSKDCECGGCFVAQIPLGGSIVKHINKPKHRHTTCYDLSSQNHWTDLRVDANSLLLQTGESLWKWRTRVSALPPQMLGDEKQERQQQSSSQQSAEDSDSPYFVVKFYSLPSHVSSQATQSGAVDSSNKDGFYRNNGINYDVFGYMGTPTDSACSDPMPPLETLLTIIVTTSPIKSNPSTEVIETTFETFLQGGNEFAMKCRKVIVCDGFRCIDDPSAQNGVSRQHKNAKQAMRNGICTAVQANNYQQFKAALRKLCADATDTSPLCNTSIEELDERFGYGFALRHALRNCVTTPYVCVIQHDRTFMRPTPIKETVKAMWHHRNVKYVGMSMRSNLMYRDLFMGKYGKTYFSEFDDMILRLPELNVDKALYGPGSHSFQNMTFGSDQVRKSTRNLIVTYRGSKQNVVNLEWLEKNPPSDPTKHQLSLTPTLFWYDNTHIAETAHYRDFVFHPPYKMVKRGGFVEDKLSPVLTRTLEKLGLREGHSRFGCYLLDDHSGLFFTGHIDGGGWMGKAKKDALLAKLKK